MDDFQYIEKITDSLRKINQSFLHVTQKIAEEHGTTRIQYMTLYKLDQQSPMSLNDLAERLHISASTASGIVDRLVQAELLDRETSEQDRRAIRLKLSPRGKEQLTRMNESVMKRLTPLLQLPKQEVEELLRLQEKLAATLQHLREES